MGRQIEIPLQATQFDRGESVLRSEVQDLAELPVGASQASELRMSGACFRGCVPCKCGCDIAVTVVKPGRITACCSFFFSCKPCRTLWLRNVTSKPGSPVPRVQSSASWQDSTIIEPRTSSSRSGPHTTTLLLHRARISMVYEVTTSTRNRRPPSWRRYICRSRQKVPAGGVCLQGRKHQAVRRDS